MNKFIIAITASLMATAYGSGGDSGYGHLTVGTSAAHGGDHHGANYAGISSYTPGVHSAAQHASHINGYGHHGYGHANPMGTAASFSGPLAVLGLLKIGAAAFMALNYFRAQNERDQYGYGYGYEHHRYKREAANEMESAMASNPEAYFTLVGSMDHYGCGKQLICELEAKSQVAKLEDDEMLMISLFGDRKSKKHEINPASAKAEYDLAAELGLATKSELMCRHRYASCPYTAQEMMDALRNAQL